MHQADTGFYDTSADKKIKEDKSKGNAYGKNKGNLSGKEFGQQRAAEARNKIKDSKRRLNEDEERVRKGEDRIKEARRKIELAKEERRITDKEYEEKKGLIEAVNDRLYKVKKRIADSKEKNKE